MKDPLMSNSRGTAILALLALNYIDIDRVSQVVEAHKTFEPNPKNRGLYDEMFGPVCRDIQQEQIHLRQVEPLNRGKGFFVSLGA